MIITYIYLALKLYEHKKVFQNFIFIVKQLPVKIEKKIVFPMYLSDELPQF